MASKPTIPLGDFERDILSALCDPDFWGRWGHTLPVTIFSPLGQRLARAVAWCHKAQRHGKRALLKAADIQAALRRDGGLTPLLKDYSARLVSGECNPAVQKALAEEMLRRGALEELIRRALAQQQTGKIDMDSLSRALRTYTYQADSLHDFDPDQIAKADTTVPPLPTPWPSINEEIEGLRVRELAMILATPKVGKTRFLLNLAVGAIEHGWSVLYVTAADVGYGDLCCRLAATWLRAPYRDVRRDPKAWATCAKEIADRKVFFSVADYSARPCSMLEIERDVERARDRATVDGKLAVFLDRMEDAIPTDKTGDMRRDITGNFQYARMLAHRYVVPIYTDSQASLRDGDEGWVDLTRGAEARVGKAKVVDLSFGVGVHPENDNVLRIQVSGRRDFHRHRFELTVDPGSGEVFE